MVSTMSLHHQTIPVRFKLNYIKLLLRFHGFVRPCTGANNLCQNYWSNLIPLHQTFKGFLVTSRNLVDCNLFFRIAYPSLKEKCGKKIFLCWNSLETDTQLSVLNLDGISRIWNMGFDENRPNCFWEFLVEEKNTPLLNIRPLRDLK